jgi:DNA-binding NtrC family response regulator
MDLQAIKNRFGIIGNAPALNHALNVATQVANTDLSVLINGESGVGKEVVSQIIHALSGRKHNPFIAVNCGAIPEGTIDSELFGHEKGSFTGASEARKGYFETVNGGTIFLDEIGEMPLGTQARLLRVLESGEFIRVGSSKVQKTDVRVIAATNRDLLEHAMKGRFREDLYYRLATVPIRIPALRERKDDILLLFRKFVVDFSERYKTLPVQLEDDAQQMLINYPFRGNVRELKNLAEQMSVLAKDKQVDGKELQQFLPDNVNMNRLPVLASGGSGGTGGVSHQEFANEREMLYKLFFDMKKDVTELKRVLFDMMQNPNMEKNMFANNSNFLNEQKSTDFMPTLGANDLYRTNNGNQMSTQPVNIVPHKNEIHEHVVVEEDLNIMHMEKDMIVRALKKHKSKRRDAALDLGISERTLYRKLKEYDIEEL